MRAARVQPHVVWKGLDWWWRWGPPTVPDKVRSTAKCRILPGTPARRGGWKWVCDASLRSTQGTGQEAKLPGSPPQKTSQQAMDGTEAPITWLRGQLGAQGWAEVGLLDLKVRVVGGGPRGPHQSH